MKKGFVLMHKSGLFFAGADYTNDLQKAAFFYRDEHQVTDSIHIPVYETDEEVLSSTNESTTTFVIYQNNDGFFIDAEGTAFSEDINEAYVFSEGPLRTMRDPYKQFLVSVIPTYQRTLTICTEQAKVEPTPHVVVTPEDQKWPPSAIPEGLLSIADAMFKVDKA